MFQGKKVLVAGGSGTIGIPVVRQLLEQEAQVTVVSLEFREYVEKILGTDIVHIQLDLTQMKNCLRAVKGQEYVFDLLGHKGSVGIGGTRAATYFYPILLHQTHLMEAAFRCNVKRYLFVGSICSYPRMSSPKKEEQIWDGSLLQNDRFTGLIKRIGEIQAETYLQEHGWDAVRIVRSTVVYGPYDDFDPATGHATPALISRIIAGEDPLLVWGDGSAIRDFIYSEEVAKWMLIAIEAAPPCFPINLGSGIGTTIRTLVRTILKYVPNNPVVKWDTTKPTGDQVRILDIERAKKYLGFNLEIDLEEGIRRTVEWYLKQRANNEK